LHNKLLVGKGKEEGRRKREEGRGEKIYPYMAGVLLLSKVICPKF